MESYYGYVRTLDDAFLLFEACEVNILRYLRRKPTDRVRERIRSGSVFIWNERDVPMERWFDRRSWKSSGRTRGFLIFKEMETRQYQGFSADRQVDDNVPDSSPDVGGNPDIGISKAKQRKKDGLVRQSLRVITPNGLTIHLISYHSSSPDELSKLQRPTNDPKLQSITMDVSLRYKFEVSKAGATSSPIDRMPKPHVLPQAVNDQYGYSRFPSPAVTSPYEPHIYHRAPATPQNCLPGAGNLGSPHQKYDDAPVHAQSVSFHAAMADLHARGMITIVDDSLHIRHRMPVAQNTTSGHTLSNCSQVGQVALPRIGSTSNAPIDFPVQAGIALPGVSFACPGSPESYVSRHDSNFAGSYESANGLAGEDMRMVKSLDRKFCI